MRPTLRTVTCQMTIAMATTAKNGFGKWASIVIVDFGNALHKFTVLADVHYSDAKPLVPEGTIQFFTKCLWSLVII